MTTNIVHYVCPSCNCPSAVEKIDNHPGGHYSRLDCSGCGRFLKWGAKPDKAKPKRRKVKKNLVLALSRGFCEICLRPEKAIPLPQTLEGHHIIPVEQGGTDEAGNIQIVCTACHRLIHHQRTYLGHYHEETRKQA